MARQNRSILEELAELPWQLSVVLSVTTFLTLQFFLPLINPTDPLFKGLFSMLHNLSFIFALVLLVPAPISALNAYRKRLQLEDQKDIDSIRKLNWRQFEELVAEAYRRKGYSVVENQGTGPDGGIDIRLEKDGKKHLIQCKQWKSRKVGVQVVREMFGIMSAENATSVTVVTSGIFTEEAKNFASGKPIGLIDGTGLVSMISDVQNTGRIKKPEQEPTQICPQCGSNLVKRTAKRGQKAGKQFWGCSKFPRCKFTMDLLQN